MDHPRCEKLATRDEGLRAADDANRLLCAARTAVNVLSSG